MWCEVSCFSKTSISEKNKEGQCLHICTIGIAVRMHNELLCSTELDVTASGESAPPDV